MSLRTIMLAGGALCATMTGGTAAAQQALDSVPMAGFDGMTMSGLDGVAMMDPETVLQQAEARTFALNLSAENARRFAPEATTNTTLQQDGDTRRVQVEFAAAGDRAGVPLDVSVAQRASLRASGDGNIDGSSRGSEVRIGRGLVRQDDDKGPRQGSALYMFIADDDDALTWAPGGGSGPNPRGSGLALEDRVDVGDMSAGVTYERNGIQASLAYIEREVSTRVGRESFSQDERFAGLTLTMRR